VKLKTAFICSALLIGSSIPVHATDVGIKLFQFQPKDITVKAGETVTWLNGDDIEHSVTAGKPGKESGVFDSDFFKKDGSYSFTFNEAGSFEYFCKRHPSMKAKITVTP
jgi:plastocyanin